MFRNIVIILAVVLSVNADTTTSVPATEAPKSQVTSSKSQVTSSKPQVTSSKPPVPSPNTELCSHNNGGCSDDCDDASGHVICSCAAKSHWVIGADGKTCVPDVEITCEKNVVSVNLPAGSVADVIGLTPYSDDPDSAPSECGFVLEDDFYRFRFDVTECSSTTQTLGTDIKFGNAIKVLLDWSEGTDLITREGNYVNINFVCSYSSHEKVSHSYWLETHKKKALEVEGLGDFTFAFDLFKDETFAEVFSSADFPVAYHFNDSIHFEISSASNIDNVELFTKSCVATPAGDLIESSISYNFMQEGCLVDSTLQEIPNDDKLKNRYKMTAFRFRSNLQGLTPETNIKLECTVMVCVMGENTRCAEKCIRPDTSGMADMPSRRKRRVDVEQDMAVETQNRILETPEHLVSSEGMFRVIGVNGRSALDVSDLTDSVVHTNKNKDLVTVIIVLGAMLCLTFGFIGFMVARRRHIRNSNVVTVNGNEELQNMVVRR